MADVTDEHTEKVQAVVIHGGETFSSREAYLAYLRTTPVSLEYLESRKSWKGGMIAALEDRIDFYSLRMPNATCAVYEEWEIWFSRFVPFLRDHTLLIGHSLGGIFLAKYLSLHTLPFVVEGTFLVAPPFSEEVHGDTLSDFSLGGVSLEGFAAQGGDIFIYQSTDDEIVSAAHARCYQKALPKATVRMFADRGHFIGEEFPEIMTDILTVVGQP